MHYFDEKESLKQKTSYGISPQPTVRGLRKCHVLNHMNVTKVDILQDEDHEENSSFTRESVGSDYLTQ
jgi:hypothetical protein